MEMTQKVQGGGVIVTLLVGNEGKPEHSIVVTGLETSEKGKIQAPLPTLPAHCWGAVQSKRSFLDVGLKKAIPAIALQSLKESMQ